MVFNKMEKTFHAQRKTINENRPVSEILELWPFLQKVDLFLVHYENLLERESRSLVENFRTRGAQVYK